MTANPKEGVQVSLVRCFNYDEYKVYEAVKKSVELIGGMDSFIKEGDRVLLKINQLYSAEPGRAVTTHPSIVRAVSKLVMECKATVTIGDSPGFGNFIDFAEKTAIKPVAEELGCELIELDEPDVFKNDDGKVMKQFELSKKIFDFDVIIDMPKLKTHSFTTFTGAVKNLFGCIPGKRKAQMHLKLPNADDFANMLLDLYQTINPHLTIMDAIIGMEGQGPNAGNPRPIGLVIAGKNGIAVDKIAADVISLKVPMIQSAIKRGLIDPKEISILGENLEDVRITDFKPPHLSHIPHFLTRFGKRMFTAKPILIQDKCIKCRTCEKACPRDAITFKEYPVFDYSKCIRCYCCHELCPKEALDLRQSLPIRLITFIKRIV